MCQGDGTSTMTIYRALGCTLGLCCVFFYLHLILHLVMASHGHHCLHSLKMIQRGNCTLFNITNISLAARAKMSLRRAQNIFMPKNINSITLEGIEKIKTEKNADKTL